MVFPELREKRKQRGLTQMALAYQAGLSMPTVVAAEQGRNISVESLLRLRLALSGSPTDDLAELIAPAGGA